MHPVWTGLFLIEGAVVLPVAVHQFVLLLIPPHHHHYYYHYRHWIDCLRCGRWYYFEFNLDNCRTNLAEMPMPYPTVCPTFCPTKVEIFTRSVRHCPPQIDDPKICRTTSNFALLDHTAHEFSSYNAVGYWLGFPVCCLTHYCLTILTGKLIDDSRKSFS